MRDEDRLERFEASDARYRAVADPVRRRLLRVLEDSGGPCDVETLAGAVALHPNTVRGHLEVLEEAGLVVSTSERRLRPGRPRKLYAATGDSDQTPPRGYRLLAEMLTTTLLAAGDDPSALAEEAGREWGAYLTEKVPPSHALAFEAATGRVVAMLADVGFDPHPHVEEASATIDLYDCPFRDLARHHRDVVCSLHRGLLGGATEALGGTAAVEVLEPFVAPSLCRAVLRRA